MLCEYAKLHIFTKILFCPQYILVFMNKDLRKVVIILAHPNMKESQANRMLIDTVKDMDGVSVFNLYEEELPFNVDEWTGVISDASAVVYQFPFYWLSAPSLLKRWQDEVFTYLSQTPAVAGKPLLVVTTTGSDAEAYRSGGKNRFTIDELLRPYQGSAIHSGMVWQTPIVLYGTGRGDIAKNAAETSALYKQKIEALLSSGHSNNSW